MKAKLKPTKKKAAKNGRVVKRLHRTGRISPEQKARDEAMRKEVADRPGPDDPRFLPAVMNEDWWGFEEFARELRDCRQRSGRTIADVSEEAGIDEASLSRLERGRGNPTLRTLMKWARAVGRKFEMKGRPV